MPWDDSSLVRAKRRTTVWPNLRLPMVRHLTLARTAAAITILSGLLTSCSNKPTESNSQAAVNNASAPVNYAPRIGVALRTSSRTCLAISNGAVQPNSPVTLVSPTVPQTFEEAQVSGDSSQPCPITKDPLPGVNNYSVDLSKSSNLPKMSPLIAVVGSAAAGGFVVGGPGVQADLDQNQSKETFRACGADDGIHLTVWRGAPLTGTRIWSGYYYEAGNPGTLPSCSAAETVTTPADQH